MAAEATAEAGEATVKTIDRAARLLTALAASESGGMMLTEAARRTGFGKATTHRLLAALVDVGFVCQDAETKLYRLGARLGILARRAGQQEVAVIAQPILDRLAEATGDTAYCSIREGAAAVCVGRATGSFPIRTLTLEVGHRRPLGAGAGSLALLAALPDAEVAEAMRRNARWLASYPGFTADAVAALVAATRRHGYALNKGQIIAGMNAMAVAALGPDGQPIAALSIAAIRDRVDGARVVELAALLRGAARELAEQMATPG